MVDEIHSRKSANILDGYNGYGAYRRLSSQAVIVLDQESTLLIEAASSVITHVREPTERLRLLKSVPAN